MGVLVGGERGIGGDESEECEECDPELSDTEEEGTSGTWLEEMWHVLISQKDSKAKVMIYDFYNLVSYCRGNQPRVYSPTAKSQVLVSSCTPWAIARQDSQTPSNAMPCKLARKYCK